MWVEVRRTPNPIIADMWKDYFEGEGIPARILPEPAKKSGAELPTYRILVSQEKVHVIEEILRKL